MFDLLNHARHNFPKRVALIDGDKKLTYEELYEETLQLAERLFSLKENKDPIAIYAENDYRTVILLFACYYAGVPLFLLNRYLPIPYLNHELEKLAIRYIITSEEGFTKSMSFNELFSLPRKRASFQPKEDSPLTYLFTSGTSSKPKIAVHSYQNHLYSALGANEVITLEPNDRWLISLPLYHVGGIGILFRTILRGATSVILKSQKELAETLYSEKITHLSLVPTQLTRLLETQKSFSLKALLIGGAKTPYSLYEKAKHLPLYLTYGLTEMSSQVFTKKAPLWKDQLPYSGDPLRYRTAKLIDSELALKGGTLFLGYLEEGKIILPVDEEGYFRTRDLATYNETYGYQIIGRKDRQFISGGENIQPEEIERVFLNLPGVLKAKVLPKPDPEYGTRPIAFIEHITGTFEEETLKKELKNLLSSYKVPDQILPYQRISDWSLKN